MINEYSLTPIGIRMREPRFRGVRNCSYFHRPLAYSYRWASGENNLGLKSVIFFCGATSSVGPWLSHSRGFTITLRHTTLVGTPLDE